MADAVAEQIAALKDEDWAIREEAATILGTLRDPRAVAPLVSVLRDSDRAVRDAAISALLAIGEPAVSPLATRIAGRVAGAVPTDGWSHAAGPSAASRRMRLAADRNMRSLNALMRKQEYSR